MDASIIVAIVGVLAAPVAAFVTWLLNRKKHIADIYNALSESSQTAVETMQMTMAELRIELVEAREKIEELISENELLREDLKALKQQNVDLIKQIHDMRVSYEQGRS
jgi:predicted nuclease with TOPRIM domain